MVLKSEVKYCDKCNSTQTFKTYRFPRAGKPSIESRCMKCQSNTRTAHRRKHPRRSWAISSLGNHIQAGYISKITVNDLYKLACKTTNCKYCDTTLIYMNKGKMCYDSATLDRRNNEQIIRLDNIDIICCRCNKAKGDMTEVEFINYCNNIFNHAVKYQPNLYYVEEVFISNVSM